MSQFVDLLMDLWIYLSMIVLLVLGYFTFRALFVGFEWQSRNKRTSGVQSIDRDIALLKHSDSQLDTFFLKQSDLQPDDFQILKDIGQDMFKERQLELELEVKLELEQELELECEHECELSLRLASEEQVSRPAE